MESPTSTLSQLERLFPKTVLLDSHQTASVLNISYKTLNNAGQKFPIPMVRFGRKKFYRVIDIAACIDGRLPIQPSCLHNWPREDASVDIRRQRGRPKKK